MEREKNRRDDSIKRVFFALSSGESAQFALNNVCCYNVKAESNEFSHKTDRERKRSARWQK